MSHRSFLVIPLPDEIPAKELKEIKLYLLKKGLKVKHVYVPVVELSPAEEIEILEGVEEL